MQCELSIAIKVCGPSSARHLHSGSVHFCFSVCVVHFFGGYSFDEGSTKRSRNPTFFRFSLTDKRTPTSARDDLQPFGEFPVQPADLSVHHTAATDTQLSEFFRRRISQQQQPRPNAFISVHYRDRMPLGLIRLAQELDLWVGWRLESLAQGQVAWVRARDIPNDILQQMRGGREKIAEGIELMRVGHDEVIFLN